MPQEGRDKIKCLLLYVSHSVYIGRSVLGVSGSNFKARSVCVCTIQYIFRLLNKYLQN